MWFYDVFDIIVFVFVFLLRSRLLLQEESKDLNFTELSPKHILGTHVYHCGDSVTMAWFSGANNWQDSGQDELLRACGCWALRNQLRGEGEFRLFSADSSWKRPGLWQAHSNCTVKVKSVMPKSQAHHTDEISDHSLVTKSCHWPCHFCHTVYIVEWACWFVPFFLQSSSVFGNKMIKIWWSSFWWEVHHRETVCPAVLVTAERRENN